MTNQIDAQIADRHRTNGKQTQAKLEMPSDSEKSPESPNSNFLSPVPDFEQAVVLRQPHIWSRSIVWTIVGVTTAALLWAAIAKIEQVIPAQGQLKPQGKVKEIQVPVNGVVKEVYVKEGEEVGEGQLLATLDSRASVADLESSKKIRQTLSKENEFYRALMEQPLDSDRLESSLAQLDLPPEVTALARHRMALVAENQLFRIQIGDSPTQSTLSLEQQARLGTAKAELDSRATAARLEMEQLEKQLQQNQVQLADTRTQLSLDRQILSEIQARNSETLEQAENSLAIEQKILQEVEPLLEEGALAKLQLERQRQSVQDRSAELSEKKRNGAIELEKQKQQIQTNLAEIDRLLEEEQRLRLAINQARARLTNTVTLSTKEIRDKMADNEKQMAEIDSQLTKNAIENEKRIAEIDSQISKTEVTLNYQEVRAPVAGRVFDLKAFSGFVPQPSQAEALLKIVPDDHLVAEVDITNQDIGFIRPGMKADVRIDSFPFSEFGDVKGEVASIGSDSLPPDEINRFYRFPTKIQLDEQVLQVNDTEIPLKSGMSVSVNIKVREKRTVLSLFTELFTKKVESLKEVR